MEIEDAKISIRIRQIRKQLEYTQEYVAQSIGISTNSYRAIESGKTVLINSRLYAIASTLNTPLEQLISGQDPEGRHLKEIEEKENEIRDLKNRLEKLQIKYDITVAEKDGKIFELNSIITSKESIIGVLKEKTPQY